MVEENNRLASNSVLIINVDEWQEQVLNSEAFDILDYRVFVAAVLRVTVICLNLADGASLFKTPFVPADRCIILQYIYIYIY